MIQEGPLFSVSNLRFNVIILAAGLGARLRPETEHIPKALVRLGSDRAIDYLLRKFQYVADQIIISVGYCADLLENYCRGRYGTLNLAFSREDVSSLAGPGCSLLYALDKASSRLPTLVTFCDYVVEDQFPIDTDALGLCGTPVPDAVLGTYQTIGCVADGVVTDLVRNDDLDARKEGGFTGIAVMHDTLFLKSIVYAAAAAKGGPAGLDYAFDIIRPYLLKVRTRVCTLSRIFEFGASDTIGRTKTYADGHQRVRS